MPPPEEELEEEVKVDAEIEALRISIWTPNWRSMRTEEAEAEAEEAHTRTLTTLERSS